ncbi:MAG: NfeD family protein [bacterium]
MKRTLTAWMAMAVLALSPAWADETNELTETAASNDVAAVETSVPTVDPRAGVGQLVYLLPIKGQIEPALLYVIRRGVQEAGTKGARAIIFVMDTPGGRLDAATDIIRTIQDLDVPTYTFVENHAFSAGALISLATDHIFMSPGSVIGDAMPIMMSPTGNVQDMPEALQEKSVSAVSALARSTAEQNGHNPKLAEKMVRRELELKIGDDVISPAGQLLTLTNVEAEKMVGEEGAKKPLLSEGTVESVEALLVKIGLGGADTVELEVTAAEEIARYIAAFAPLFLMAGLLGIYIEIKTPGFGLPGMLGALSLAIFFWGHHIAGLAGMEEVLIFIIGVALLLTELFVFPGTGIIGITGGFLILWALLTAMIHQFPDDPWYPTLPQLKLPLANLSIGIILAAIGGAFVIRFLPHISVFDRIALGQTTSRDKGYTASALTTELLGREGVAVTPLHPGGSAMFGERRMDVVTRGDFVSSGARIIVVEAHGNRVVVEPAKDKAT